MLYELCKHPRCKEKLMREVSDMRKEHGIDNIFPLSVANNMPYLQACIYEALRCHPAVGMSLPCVVPPEGVEVAGRHLPAGVRNPSTFLLTKQMLT